MLKSLFSSNRQATIEDQPDQGKRIIYMLATVAVILAILGTVNLYSATQGSGIFYNQLVYLGLGFALIVLIGFILPLNMFNTYTHVFYGVICLALMLVLLIGDSAGGAQRLSLIHI